MINVLLDKSDIELANIIHNAGYTLGEIEGSAIVDEDFWAAAMELARRIKGERP